MNTALFDIIKSAAIQPAAMALSTEDALKQLQEALDKGADINGLDKWGGSALIAACMEDLQEIALFLLEKGADPSIVDNSDTRSALHYASENAMLPVVEKLLATKLDVDAKDVKELTPINFLCIGARDKFNIVSPKVTDSSGKDVPNHPHVKAINDKNASVLETARLLIEHGADLTIGPNNQPPLFIAGQSGNGELVQILLDAGSDPNTADSFSLRPLHFAARAGMLDTVTKLIEGGAELDYQDKFGFTALHEAILSNSKDCVAYLLDKGADTTIKLKEGFKPYTNNENALDMAKDKKNKEIIALVEKHTSTK